MALQLPRYLALKSLKNNRYLLIDGVHGILEFSGEKVVSPYTKFHAEDANGARPDGHLVNISSCYNNKYWRTVGENDRRIQAKVDEPEENEGIWSCTHFRYEYVHEHQEDNSIVQLRHVYFGHYLQINPENECLIVSEDEPGNDNSDLFKFEVIDWEALVILPTPVAFIGDTDFYLRVQRNDEIPYLQFSATDPTDPTVEFEVLFCRDGDVRTRSTYNQMFWRRNSSTPTNTNLRNWIWAGSDDLTDRDINMLFRPVKVTSNDVNVVVALRNQANRKFCRRLTRWNIINCLNADLSSMAIEAHLRVEELVQSRTIFDLKFHHKDARIYNSQEDFVVAIGQAENRTREPADEVIRLSYEDTKRSTWISNIDDVDFTSPIPTTLTSDTLFVVDHNDHGYIIGILGRFDGPYHWGEDISSPTPIQPPIQIGFPVVVPPRSNARVTLLATRASCDIPFSYSQRDTLKNNTRKLLPTARMVAFTLVLVVCTTSGAGEKTYRSQNDHPVKLF